MKIKHQYPDLLANLFNSAKAWRTVALLMIGIVVAQAVMLMWMAGQRTVLLVPQNLPNNKGAITLNLGEPFSPDYLTAIAKGDAYSLLSWTPDTIEAQYGLFLSRLSPASYDVRREALLAEAKSHKEEGLTQSFYVARTFVNGSSVTLHGVLVRAMGGKEVFRGPAAYTLGYANVGNGVVLVSGVHQPSEEEYRAIEAKAHK